ncbi:hypothetical protein BT96DRAFT_1018996 [Gymnopus androsaceus JB14]|uniref:DUF6534 domain-containing protein n=1 Tax=Gymnopus androsaceus JB14 TaxID=1447944 RepID=A0A6A4HT73_9AGAR|nr:hypothetical protein BT96DRAFT_1018996 [Gymnopus androsaceus JB14]
MPALSPAEQAQINISVGGVVVSNYLSVRKGLQSHDMNWAQVLLLQYLTMGIVLCAAWSYFSKFPNDTWWLKSLVILCVSMCIVDTIGTGIWSYDWAVANYGNPSVMAFIPWELPSEGFLMTTCGLTVQLFYAWRIWMMSMRKNWILSVVIGCLSILGWCIVCWMTHIGATHKSISDLTLVLPVAYIWLVGSVAADVLITGSMIYYLDLRFRMKPEFPSGISAIHGRLRKLLVRTVECNLLSLLAQAIAVGLFNCSNIGFYFVIPDMMLAKIYTFSLLVSLNCRHTNNDHGTTEGGSSSRGDGGVELTALHTSSIPSTQLVSAHTQETAGDLEEQMQGPAFNYDKYDAHVLLSLA